MLMQNEVDANERAENNTGCKIQTKTRYNTFA
jgi:hypothetical protein